MERIEIKHFDLENVKNHQTTEAYIELHDTYFRYVYVYDCEIPKDSEDLLQGWKDVFYDADMRIKRENFISVEKYWNDKDGHWKLEIEVNGYPGTINLYYTKEDKERMLVIFEQLFKWIFKI